jgi:Ca2+-binding RTX toxin-like protein
MTIRSAVTGEVDSYNLFEDLSLGDGDNWIAVANPADRIRQIAGGEGNDTLTLHVHAGSAADIPAATVYGEGGDDVISIATFGLNAATIGRALYSGGGGNDRFIVEDAGTAREFDGGLDIDTVDYSAVPSNGISVSIDDDPNDGPTGGDNVPGDVEVIIGTQGSDTLIGDIGQPSIYRAQTLVGNGGDDSLVGNAGADLLVGGRGADTLLGGDGDDTLIGGQGIDLLDGAAGSNILIDDLGLQLGSKRSLLDQVAELR